MSQQHYCYFFAYNTMQYDISVLTPTHKLEITTLADRGLIVKMEGRYFGRNILSNTSP